MKGESVSAQRPRKRITRKKHPCERSPLINDSTRLSVHIHRDGYSPADGLAPAEDEQRDLDSARDNNTVSGQGQAVEDQVFREVGDGEDMQGIRVVYIDEVRHNNPARGDHAEGHRSAMFVRRRIRGCPTTPMLSNRTEDLKGGL